MADCAAKIRSILEFLMNKMIKSENVPGMFRRPSPPGPSLRSAVTHQRDMVMKQSPGYGVRHTSENKFNDEMEQGQRKSATLNSITFVNSWSEDR